MPWGRSNKNTLATAGFHDDQHGVQELGDYAYYAKADGLGDDWVDVMYTHRSGADNDDCAVSIVFAADGTEADDAYYYGGLADEHSTGAHVVNYYYYVEGCDPAAGAAL